MSLELIEAAHRRSVALLRRILESDWHRCFRRPETGEVLALDTNPGIDAWHSRHHIAYVTGLRGREGW